MSSTTTSHVITTFDRSYLFIFVNALCVSSFALCLVPAQKHAFTRAPHSRRRNACLSESLNLSQDNVQQPTCLAKQAAYVIVLSIELGLP